MADWIYRKEDGSWPESADPTLLDDAPVLVRLRTAGECDIPHPANQYEWRTTQEVTNSLNPDPDNPDEMAAADFAIHHAGSRAKFDIMAYKLATAPSA